MQIRWNGVKDMLNMGLPFLQECLLFRAYICLSFMYLSSFCFPDFRLWMHSWAERTIRVFLELKHCIFGDGCRLTFEHSFVLLKTTTRSLITSQKQGTSDLSGCWIVSWKPTLVNEVLWELIDVTSLSIVSC